MHKIYQSNSRVAKQKYTSQSMIDKVKSEIRRYEILIPD